MRKMTILILIIKFFVLIVAIRTLFAQGERQKDSFLGKTESIAVGTLKAPFELVEGILSFDLGKLVITPTKYKKYLKDVTVSASIVDKEEFQKGIFYDASNPLDKINSVRIERFGSWGQSASPVIRGMTGTRVLVLIDGIPYNSPSLGEADLSMIPMAKIERIEVVRGPYSSLYGADAVGGVINIITKDPPEKAGFKTSYSFGSWNTHNVMLEAGSKFGKFGYNIIADYLFTDGARVHSDHNGLDLTSKVKLDIYDGINYIFYVNYYLARTEHPGAQPAKSLDERTPTQKVLGNEDASSLFDYSRTSRIHLNSVLNIKNFTANHYFMYWNDDSHRESISFLNNIDRLVDNDEYMTYIYGMEYKYIQPLWDIDTVTIGASFDRKVFKVKTHQFNENTIQHTFGGRDSVRREWAVYGENEFRLYPFNIVVGLRYDNPSDYTTRLSPKISGMLDLGFDTKLRASYGRAYRAPTLNDINWPQDAYAEGNPALKPEKTESWEIGVEKLIEDFFLLRATFFQQRIMDAIVWAPVGSRVQLPWFSYARWTPTNLNRLSTKGVELETNFKMFNNIDMSFKYTYLNAVETITAQRDWSNDRLFLESRRPASYVPSHKFYGDLEWKDPFDIKGLVVNTDLRFVSERRNYYASYGTWPDTSISYPKKILASYFLWNAKVRYRYKNTELFFAVDNILDTGFTKFGNTLQDRDYPQPGICFTGGISSEF